MTNWISVKDRLPEKDGAYWVINFNKYIYQAYYCSAEHSSFNWHNHDGCITHWRSLSDDMSDEDKENLKYLLKIAEMHAHTLRSFSAVSETNRMIGTPHYERLVKAMEWGNSIVKGN